MSHRGWLGIALAVIVVGLAARYIPTVKEGKAPPNAGGATMRVVFANGTVRPVNTVSIAAEISGSVLSLSVDYDSPVRAGEVVAQIDPSPYETQLKEARAALATAEAGLRHVRAEVESAQVTLSRAEALQSTRPPSAPAAAAARAALEAARAAVRDGESSVARAGADVDQASQNIAHTVIRSPIDGIVVGRSVEVGQSLDVGEDSLVLFTVATDLDRMQVEVDIDESDITDVRAGKSVTVTVDAYPGATFNGTVNEIRVDAHQPAASVSTVTYVAIVDVPNGDGRLKPGMMAEVALPGLRRGGVRGSRLS